MNLSVSSCLVVGVTLGVLMSPSAFATTPGSCSGFREKVVQVASEYGSTVTPSAIPSWFKYGPMGDSANRGGKAYGALVCGPDDTVVETFELCARPAFPGAADEFQELLGIVGNQLGVGSDVALEYFAKLYTRFLSGRVAGDLGGVTSTNAINGYEFTLKTTPDDGVGTYHQVCLFIAKK
ncbi:hypothetical protein [Maritalea porphyrae]|uniref:hypothetical protein n=1 Tax=Maritalea porphyrae TaxID=880732 RepID=UPI0022AF43B2|nr:hypothetical protein [Maritalea porphyrae]MCZ4270765.1 hypothetical protein [Maritalea porphyrae]